MSSPGGEEVGRVSIRVVPDTSGFRQKLKAELEWAEQQDIEIPVGFDVDTAGLKAQLQALEKSKVTIPVDLGDGTEIQRLRARLEALDNAEVNIPVNLDLQGIERINAALARLRSRKINIHVQVHGLGQALAQFVALDVFVNRLDGRTINIHVDVDAAAATAQVAALETAMAGLRTTLGSVGSGGSRAFGGMRGQILSAAGALTLLPPLAVAVATAGAAITAAWGFLSTAIAAAGPALMLLAAPIAAVMAGLDGIKAAAKTIKPEFDKLKKAVSGTFERGMIPIFKQLTEIFPQLTTGLQGTATALIAIAQRLTDMLVSAAGIQRIEQIFVNVNRALTDMAPGIAAIVDAFLILGSQTSVFDALTKAVNTFGAEFRSKVIDTVTDGTLDRAMEGLGESLAALSRAFTSLVENGIRVFAAAAPGVNRVMDSITNFFNRFDWNSLGQSVSRVFDGIATAINNVPESTIRGIEAAFADLADTFQSEGFQSGLTRLIDALPEAISLVDKLAQAFGPLATEVANAIESFDELTDGVSTLLSDVAKGLDDFSVAIGLGSIKDTPKQFQSPLHDWIVGLIEDAERGKQEVPPRIEAIGTESANAAERSMQDVVERGRRGLRGGGGTFGKEAEALAGEVPPAVEQGVAGTEQAVTNGLSPAAAALVAVLNEMPPHVQTAFEGLSGDVAAGMTAMTQAINDGGISMRGSMDKNFADMASSTTVGMEGVRAAIEEGFNTAGAAIETGMQTGTQSIANGTAEWTVAVTTGMEAIGLTIEGEGAQWGVAMDTAMTAMQTTVTSGYEILKGSAEVGMQGITQAISNETAQWVIAIDTGMEAVSTALTTQFELLSVGATTGMQAVTQAISNETAQWVIAIDTGMEAVQLTVEAGFVTLSESVVTGMESIKTSFTTGWQGIGAQISLELNTITNTLTLSLTTMKDLVATKMVEIQTAFTNGLVTIKTTITTEGNAWAAALRLVLNTMLNTVVQGFTSIKNEVTTGLQSIKDLFSTGWADVNTGLTDAMNTATETVRTGMTNMTNAARDGMVQITTEFTNGGNRAVTIIENMITRCVSALNGAVSKFRTAGANMGQALADGLNSKARTVEAAARRLADAAAAATRAAAGINSPSRVFTALGEFMGEGLENGLRAGEAGVARAADDLAQAAISAASGVQDAFASDRWARDFNARVNAELSAHDGTDPAASGKQVVIQTTINNPIPETGSDSVAKTARRQAAMGLFG